MLYCIVMAKKLSIKKKIEKYIIEACKRLNLSEWKIYINYAPIDKKSSAEVLPDSRYTNATITINKDYKFKNDNQIRETIYHECLHILLAHYVEKAEDRFISEKELIDREEQLVERLLRIII